MRKKPPLPRSKRPRCPFITLAHLAAIGVAWFVVWILWRTAPGQSVGAAAGHAVATLAVAAVLAVHSVVSSVAVVLTARRRGITWLKLGAIHLASAPTSVVVAGALAWVGATLDDRVLPRIPGTSAWEKAHPERALSGCLPVEPIRVATIDDDRAVLVIQMGPDPATAPWLKEATLVDPDTGTRWQLARRGRVARQHAEDRSDGWRLIGQVEPADARAGTRSRIVIGCGAGFVQLEPGVGALQPTIQGGLPAVIGPLGPEVWTRATAEEQQLLDRWAGPGRQPQRSPRGSEPPRTLPAPDRSRD